MANNFSLNPNANIHASPILLVDDQPQNLAALQQVLSAEYGLVFARNGADAIAAALKHIPALILLDIEMPDMDGYAVCRALKADSRTEAIPVFPGHRVCPCAHTPFAGAHDVA